MIICDHGASLLTRLQISLGEMIAYLPLPGGHIRLAERYVDSAFSFTMVSTVPHRPHRNLVNVA